MLDWTSAAGTLLGYAIVAALFVLPVALLVLVFRSRWFRERKRAYHPAEWPVWWQTTMDRLPPPFGDWPPGPHDPRKRRRPR